MTVLSGSTRRKTDALRLMHLSNSVQELYRGEFALLANNPIHAKIPASDINRAKRFYEKLGFAQIGEGPTGIFYGSADTKFYVFRTANAGTNRATAASWEVEDIESEMAELRSRRVVFEEYDLPKLKTVNGIAVIGNEKAAWFKDSEGNILNYRSSVALNSRFERLAFLSLVFSIENCGYLRLNIAQHPLALQ